MSFNFWQTVRGVKIAENLEMFLARELRNKKRQYVKVYAQNIAATADEIQSEINEGSRVVSLLDRKGITVVIYEK